VLRNEPLDRAVWWSQPPSARINITPEKLVADLTNSPQNSQMFDQRFQSLRELKRDLAVPGASLHFERLEASGIDGLNPYGSALYEVHVPADKGAKEKDQYAHVFYKAMKNKQGKDEWWVDQVSYPAKPGTFQLPAKAGGEGHGHAH
jgi:hypothetical protein